MRSLAVLLALASTACSYLLPSLQAPPPCPTGTVLCDNLSCSDLKTDPFNCGFCQNACGQGLDCSPLPDGGASVCLCTIPGNLFWNGACYDLSNDPRNCGALGAACATTQACIDGGCSCVGIGGDSGFAQCTSDGGPLCTDLTTDPHNCGSCGNDCGDDADCGEGGVCVPLDAGIFGDAGLLNDAGASDGGVDAGPDAGDDGGVPDGGDAGDGGDGGS